MSGASLSSHVLDLEFGKPARELRVTLFRENSTEALASALTDEAGRIGPAAWSAEIALTPGNYRLAFETGQWYAARGQQTLYPVVEISFSVGGDHPHYHIPLLLSPFGYSTYRGN